MMLPLVKGELGDSGPLLSNSNIWWVQLMAREKPGVPLGQARAGLERGTPALQFTPP